MKKCRKCFFPLYAKVVECFGKYKQIREPFPFVLYIISPKIFFFLSMKNTTSVDVFEQLYLVRLFYHAKQRKRKTK